MAEYPESVSHVATAALAQSEALAVLVAAGLASLWLLHEWVAGPQVQARDDITRFLRSLEHALRINGDARFLQLDGFVDRWNRFTSDETNVFLRPCYHPLLAVLRRRNEARCRSNITSRQVILGTPGTGKSFFRVVLARDLLFGKEISPASTGGTWHTVHVVFVKCCGAQRAGTGVNKDGVVLTRDYRSDYSGELVGGVLRRRGNRVVHIEGE